MERGGACGRGSSTTDSGGVGAPPGWPLRAACQELADDRGWNTSAKAPPGAGRRTPRWSAERRAGQRHWPVIPGDPGIGPTARRATGCGASAPAPVGAPPPAEKGKMGRRRTRRRKEYGRRSFGFCCHLRFSSPCKPASERRVGKGAASRRARGFPVNGWEAVGTLRFVHPSCSRPCVQHAGPPFRRPACPTRIFASSSTCCASKAN
jgi:hypothetical protein